MATRFIHSGPEIPRATGNAVGFGVEENGNLVVNRGADWKSLLSSDPGEELVQVSRVITRTTSGTLTKADSGALIIADSTTSVVMTLPSTAKGLTYTLVVKQLTSSGGHAFSPAAADKIMGNGFTSADDKDAICSAATDREGDLITLVGDGVDGWYVASVTGTWAREA